MKPNISFTVDSDLYNIYVGDNSCWGIAEDLPAVIEITTPGRDKSVNKFFNNKGSIATYNSKCLCLDCGGDCNCKDKLEVLPDGVYHIKLKASPDSFYDEHYYLKIDSYQRIWDKAFISGINKGCTECKKELFEAKGYIEAAKASIRSQDVQGAVYFYKSAYRIADKMSKCKDC